MLLDEERALNRLQRELGRRIEAESRHMEALAFLGAHATGSQWAVFGLEFRAHQTAQDTSGYWLQAVQTYEQIMRLADEHLSMLDYITALSIREFAYSTPSLQAVYWACKEIMSLEMEASAGVQPAVGYARGVSRMPDTAVASSLA